MYVTIENGVSKYRITQVKRHIMSKYALEWLPTVARVRNINSVW